MATVKTNGSRTQNARNFIDSFNECDGDASAYMFIGGVTPWENEDEPPVPDNSIKEYYKVHNEMLSLKRVNDLDVHYMIPRIKWISGTVYDMYRHDYNLQNRAHSGASNLYDAIYYVLSQNNYIYVCLNNATNKPSLVEPQNISDDPFVTSDGYQWLKLFKVSSEQQQFYSTTNLIPVTDEDVNSKPAGAVYTALVDEPGTRYTNNPAGPIADVPDYYCRVVGDGYGAVAKVKVRGESVDSIEIVRPGEGYTFGHVDFRAGHVYKGLAQLDAERNPLNPSGAGDFRSTVIISPPTGWGYEPDDELEVEENNEEARHRLALQLSSRTVGVFSSFKDPLMDAYTNLDFRQIGILHKVKAQRGYENSTSLSAVYSVKVDQIMRGTTFEIGELIEQPVAYIDKVGQTAVGKVVSWDSENNIIRYILDDETLNERGNAVLLKGSERIVGRISEFTVKPDTTFNESIEGTQFVSGYGKPEIVKHTGYLTYLTNISPIRRVPTQTERISLTITF
jgi:hypothetical protein